MGRGEGKKGPGNAVVVSPCNLRPEVHRGDGASEEERQSSRQGRSRYVHAAPQHECGHRPFLRACGVIIQDASVRRSTSIVVRRSGRGKSRRRFV